MVQQVGEPRPSNSAVIVAAIIGAVAVLGAAVIAVSCSQSQVTEPRPNPQSSAITASQPKPEPTFVIPARYHTGVSDDPSISPDWDNPQAGIVWVRIPDGYDSVWIVSWDGGVLFNNRPFSVRTTIVSHVDIGITNLRYVKDSGNDNWAFWAVAFKGWSDEEILQSQEFGCDNGQNIQIVDVSGAFHKYTGKCGNMD